MAQKRVVWTVSALADVDAIAAFIARDSEFYASAVVDQMLDSVASLADLARDPSVREVFVHSWRLMYRVQPDMVTVLTVVHQKRRFQPNPDRFGRQ